MILNNNDFLKIDNVLIDHSAQGIESVLNREMDLKHESLLIILNQDHEIIIDELKVNSIFESIKVLTREDFKKVKVEDCSKGCLVMSIKQHNQELLKLKNLKVDVSFYVSFDSFLKDRQTIIGGSYLPEVQFSEEGFKYLEPLQIIISTFENSC